MAGSTDHLTRTPAGHPAGVRLSGSKAPRWAADRRLVEASVVAVMVVWAANFIVVKDVLDVMPPVAFTFTRYALAAVTLLLILRWSEGQVRFPSPGGWRIVGLGALGFGVYQVFWTVGLQTIPAGDSALIISAAPVITAVLAAAIGTDTLDRTKAVGVVLSFVGVMIVIGAGVGIELAGEFVGFALTLGAALCWAIYTSFGARLLRRESPLVLITWGTVGGTLVLAPFGIGQLLTPGAVDLETPGAVPQIVLSVVYSGIIAAAIANIVVFNGVRLLGPTRVTNIQALIPAFAVVLAYLLLGEPIRLGQLVGGAIILVGVAVMRYASRRVTTRGALP